MKKILICQHGGSGNHGCEALARTAVALMRQAEPECAITLYSYSALEDKRYLQDLKGVDIRGFVRLPGKYSLHNLSYHARRLLKQPASKLPITAEFRALVDDADLVVAIGGDNYCYNLGRGYWALDRFVKSRGKPYMLLGCSIEPDDLPRGLAAHLKLFDSITVREGISMEAMETAGMKNIHSVPDSAFLLEARDSQLPPGLLPHRAVGINFSPLVMENEKVPGMTLRAFSHLARHILNTTDLQLALIPHVVWPGSNDLKALEALRDALSDQSDRVFLVSDRPAEELKGIIGRLRFFVGARTHATIAAYSCGVPTLTLGYSVKARGIARDLFGTHQGFVVPVQGLNREDQLTEAFKGIQLREPEIRARLTEVLPEYKTQAGKAVDCFTQMLAGCEPRAEHQILAPDKDSVAGLIGRERCVGCGACAVVCPVGCIDRRIDREGFAQPHIDGAACTGCGACRRVCPAARPAGEPVPRAAYAAVAADGGILPASSSGGAFTVLARQALARGAAVYGAAFDSDFKLRHIRCESAEELAPLQSSKYVQSDSEAALADALTLLREGREVFFCGTTCQVNALALAAPKELRDRLTLVDVVCHGVPSPKVFAKYREELEAEAGAPMTGINFRDKSTGWQSYSVTATFENGSRISTPAGQNAYMRLFLQNLSLRRSCYTCISKRSPQADLTLADFWGIKQVAPGFDWSGGASLVLVRTDRGQALLDSAGADLRVRQVPVEGLERHNPCIYKPVPRPESRKEFFAQLDGEALPALAARYTRGPAATTRLRRLLKK